MAESFGDLDPKLDAREADLEPGQEWTGWHRVEKDLFPPAGYTALTAAERADLATQLVADTEDLARRTRTVELYRGQARQRRQGTAGRSRHRQGHRRGGNLVPHRSLGLPGQRRRRPDRLREPDARAAAKDPALAGVLETKFAALQAELKKHCHGDGFAYYTELSPSQVQQLAALVDALGEPLAKLTAAVVL